MPNEIESQLQSTHTLSLLVANKPGVLVRVCLIFSRRGFNLESLVVSPTMEGRFSRMTLTACGDPKTLEQIIKQAQKLIDVVHVIEHSGVNSVERELALIKLQIEENKRVEILQIVAHFKAETTDINPSTLIIQVTGSTEKLDAMLSMLENHSILEVVRTGKIVMARGVETT